MISIKHLSWAMIASAVVLIWALAAGLHFGAETRRHFADLTESWTLYSSEAEQTGDWISAIRGHLGYGGIIHNFKNYVIRQDPGYRDEVLRQLERFDGVVAAYRASEPSEAEQAALGDIVDTVARYRDNLAIADRGAAANWPAERTDGLVRVDDARAIAGLATLETVWRDARRQGTARLIDAVRRGETLTITGFVAMFLLVVAAAVLSTLIFVLARNVRRSVARLAEELAARARVERSEKLLAEVVEQSPATILITDTGGVIRYVNRRFEQASGWPREEVIGQTPKFLESGDTPRDDYREIWRLLRNGDRWQGLFRNLRRDGSSFWVDTVILPLRGTDGVIHSYVGVGEDITDRREARDQVARAQKLEAVGLLAGGIAHDFNNILTTIVGSAHLAAEEAPPGSEQAQDIAQISIAARRAKALVRQLLGFARRETSKSEPIKLDGAIGEAADLLRAAIAPTIVIETPDDAPICVLADQTHLHQILINLGTNAAEAIGERPGCVRFSVERLTDPPADLPGRPDGWVQLCVDDDGPGIPEVERQRVFDAFYTTKPLGKGSGLGLAVVQGLVQDMGGLVRIGTSRDGGARFCVLLPAAAATAGQRAVPKAGVAPHGHGRLLLVDDRTEIAATFRRVLERLGYRVDAFTAPEIALKAFREKPDRVDLVISDVVMPGMSGTELVTEMRKLRPDLPVVLWTGFKRAALDLPGPVPAVLSKPVDPLDLARAVHEALLPARRP